MGKQKNIKSRIIDVLDKIRPYLNEDGGDVEYVSFNKESGYVFIKLTGACRTCPISTMTVQAGIQRFILKDIPEAKRVVNVT